MKIKFQKLYNLKKFYLILIFKILTSDFFSKILNQILFQNFEDFLIFKL